MFAEECGIGKERIQERLGNYNYILDRAIIKTISGTQSRKEARLCWHAPMNSAKIMQEIAKL